MTVKKEGMLEILAALLVLVTAMFNPKISLVLAVIALAGLGIYHIVKKA